MKMNLIMRVEVSEGVTEEEMMKRFEAWVEARENDHVLFRGDCCLTGLTVETPKDVEDAYSNLY